jgi:hypothetical protein
MKKNYWLRGLVTAIIIYIVLYCVLIVVDDFGLLFSLLSPGTWFIIGIGGVDAGTKYMVQLLTSVVIWAALGAFVGWVYGKIKSRKNIGTKMN